jgi:hypothetical protein
MAAVAFDAPLLALNYWGPCPRMSKTSMEKLEMARKNIFL